MKGIGLIWSTVGFRQFQAPPLQKFLTRQDDTHSARRKSERVRYGANAEIGAAPLEYFAISVLVHLEIEFGKD